MGIPSIRQLDPAELRPADDMPKRVYRIRMKGDEADWNVIAHQNSIVTSGALLFTDFDFVDQYGRGHSPKLVKAFSSGVWETVDIVED